MREATIDLSRHADKTVTMLAGQPRGKSVRAKERFAEFDRGDFDKVEVLVPSYVTIILPSFFIGLFKPSIDKLGEDRFCQLFSFNGPVAQKALAEGLRMYRLFGVPISLSGED